MHRDIKPENVLISDSGEVKIADFGLVRAVAEAKITSTSVILGTAAYLSPEQVSTGDADPRSDVYSVGILAYELLTGDTPFTGDSALAVAYQRMDHDVPAPGTVIAGVPTQFDELVLHATARDPARRYADARDMADDLRRDRRRSRPARLPRPGAEQLGSACRGAHRRHRRQETPARLAGAAPAHPRDHPRRHSRRRSPNISRYQGNSPVWISTSSIGRGNVRSVC